ncbi:LysR family transcriptional regulator [Microbacterium fluvii]|uniref:LysR family transcriptional regulator n=2 Tax=Microbacterium fluvii TaxID=415215 RepID=A0ABW2HDK5_9MICO
MDLRVFASFVAVVEEGSISAGARRASITQPAMSRQIAGLERDLGVALFVRGSGGLRTTTAGSRFYERVTDLLSLAENIIGRTKQEGTQTVAALHVIAPPATIDSGIVPFLVSRGEGGPTLDCEPADPFRVFDIAQARGADLALSTRTPPPMWRHSKLSDGVVRAHVPRSHSLAGRGFVAIEELLDEPLIVLTPNNAARRIVDDALSSLDRPFEFSQVVRHPAIGAAMAAAGRGIALLTDDALRGTVAIPVIGPAGPLLVPVNAAWSPTNPRRDEIEALVGELTRFLDLRRNHNLDRVM